MKEKERTCMREIRLAVFDFDNTLWENLAASEFAAKAFITKLCETSNLPEDAIKKGIRQAFENNLIFEFPDTIRHNPVLQAAFPGENLDERFAEATLVFHETMHACASPYQGVRAMLRRLKLSGVKLACYSESNAADLARRMKHMGIDSLFDIVCSSPAEVQVPGSSPEPIVLHEIDLGLVTRHVAVRNLPHGSPKDHPEILHMLLRELGVRAENAIMVGDHLARDVAMAQKAGMRGFWAKYGRKAIGDLRVTPEVRPYIQAMCEQHLKGLHAYVEPNAVLESPEDVIAHIDFAARKVIPFPALRLSRRDQAAVDGDSLR